MNKTPILRYTLEELTGVFKGMGEPAYRAKQVYEWLYRRRVSGFGEMTNLSAALREKLDGLFSITSPAHEVFTSKDGTKKFRFILSNGDSVESVWIPEAARNTLCISSQVGCAMKCAFCVTGAMGFKRNMTADEIVAQVREVKMMQDLPVSNIVFMGMGEPLLNMENVIQAIDVLAQDQGLKFGRRKISVSTVGIAPKIAAFAEATGVKIAVSLTGTNDKDRDHWMPINETYNLKELTGALKKVPMGKGKHYMFEIVLLAGRTDSDRQAEELATLLKGMPAKVNLIPYNENAVFPDLKRPAEERVLAFQNILLGRGIRTMVRKNRGTDIMAACGQLAGKQIERT